MSLLFLYSTDGASSCLTPPSKAFDLCRAASHADGCRVSHSTDSWFKGRAIPNSEEGQNALPD